MCCLISKSPLVAKKKTMITRTSDGRYRASVYSTAKRAQVRRIFSTKADAVEFQRRVRSPKAAGIPVALTAASPAVLADIQSALEALSGTSASLTEAARFFAAHIERKRSLRILPGDDALIEQFAAGRDCRETTADSYRKCLLAVSRRLDGRLGRATTEQWSSLMADDSLSVSSRNSYLRHARVFYGWLVAEDRRRDNPVSGISTRRVESREVSVLSVDEATRLMRCVESIAPRHARAFAISLFAGVRPTAVSKITDDDIADEIRVNWSADKTGQQYFATVSENLRQWLDRYDDDQDYVISRSIRDRVCRMAGIQWSNDIMRHTFASHHLAAHGDLSATVHALNHRSPDMLYRHYRAAVSKEDGNNFFKISPTMA